MLYGVKLNSEELFMAKKKGVFKFYMVKTFEKFLKSKSLFRKKGEGDILADKFS